MTAEVSAILSIIIQTATDPRFYDAIVPAMLNVIDHGDLQMTY